MRRFFPALLALLLCVPSALLAQTAPARKPASSSADTAAIGVAATAAKAAPLEEAATKLPVKRVVLFKNGVGYFEHLGRVRGNQDVSIDFTSGQLNDVLKSLTALDLGSGRITGVNYNSDAPLSRRLAALRLPLGEQATVAQFLGALRGARIEVRSGTSTYTGRLLSIEPKTRIKDNTTITVMEVSLISDASELRTVELGSTTSVRILERELSQEVSRYMGLVASTRDRDLRRMTISTAGTGERPLFVSYISEVPIWKTTYRLVLPSKATAKPLLQGWAIVDNTVGEDWNDVELSLVAGAPQSFIQNLSQPYYSRRPVVPLPESVQLTPQTHQATLSTGAGQLAGNVTDPSGAIIAGATVRVYDETNNLVGETNTDDEGNYQFDSLPIGNHRVEVAQQGFQRQVFSNVNVSAGTNVQNAQLNVGAVAETVTVEAGAAMLRAPMSAPRRGVVGGVSGGIAGGKIMRLPMDPSVVRDRLEAGAQAQQLGDLFEYKLKERVTILKNQSALVPIVHAEIGAEKVSLWNESQGSPRPLRALWLTNSSNLTLDGGSFSVLEEETFAGEGLLEALKPGEKRLLSYATDLGMMVDTKQESEAQRVTRVRILRGVMIHTSELRERKTYTIRNEDTGTRTAVIEHLVRPGWKLAKEITPAETTPSYYRFRVSVEPKKTTALVVNESRLLDATYSITNLSSEQIALFLRQKTINAEVEAALRRIVAQQNVVAGFATQINERNAQIQKIFEDQSRLRENMKALKGTAEEKALLQRYTAQLNDQETRLDALRKELADLEAQKQKAQAELDKLVQELTLDVSL